MEPLSRRSPAQAGVVLIVALVVLALMTLAAVSVIRSTDTGTLVAGNLAFRQATLHASDVAVDRAWEELVPKTYTSKTYYFSTRQTNSPNLTTLAGVAAATVWTSTSVPCFDERGSAVDCAADAGGYRIQYLIERQCDTDPDLADARSIMLKCSVDPLYTASATAAAVAAKRDVLPNELNIYFRVIVRARGPRGTVAFYEVMVSGPAT